MRKKRILGICGTQKKGGFSSSEFLLNEALSAAEKAGAETKLVKLVDFNILPCEGCGLCMAKKNCPLLKNPEDQFQDLYRHCVWADAFIFSSPVYALSLPSIWKKWIDRCEPCDISDFNFDHYCYDTVKDVKGKAFKGKVAAQIVVAAGPGHEWALSSLLPAFTCIKLSVIASVGLSLIEYDAQPGIQSQPWAKDIKDSGFAINIAKEVGKRVFETIGYSTFKIENTKNRLCSQDVENYDVLTIEGELNNAVTGADRDHVVLVAGGLAAAEKSLQWLQFFKKFGSEISTVQFLNLALVDQLPPFITRDFVQKRVVENVSEFPSIFDWDMNFANQFGIPDIEHPSIIFLNTKKKQIKIFRSFDFNSHFTQLINNEISRFFPKQQIF